MSSTLTIQFDLRDWPDPPILGVIGRVGDRTDLVAQVALHEPISTAGLSMVAKQVVRHWVEPELYSNADEAVHDYLSAIGTRLL